MVDFSFRSDSFCMQYLCRGLSRKLSHFRLGVNYCVKQSFAGGLTYLALVLHFIWEVLMPCFAFLMYLFPLDAVFVWYRVMSQNERLPLCGGAEWKRKISGQREIKEWRERGVGARLVRTFSLCFLWFQAQGVGSAGGGKELR